uniref:DUF2829 domain-containing protein n=1 Tax=Trichocoleus desertorum TaxID=1481672 RepID=UPI0025B3E625|nr:DUF2829 domain-containing protein [Trichocoleus desertorum]
MAGIGEVVAHLKQGGGARRAGWNGKGMYVYLNSQTVLRDETTIESVVVLKTPRGTHQPGWVCSQEDLLTEDWELVNLTATKPEP